MAFYITPRNIIMALACIAVPYTTLPTLSFGSFIIPRRILSNSGRLSLVRLGLAQCVDSRN